MKKYLLTFHLFLICGLLHSQSHPDSVGYLKSYLTNTRDILTEPFHWNVNDVANFTMVAGGTAFLMIYDEHIDDFMLRNQNEKLTGFCETVLDPFGNGGYSLPLLGAVYLAGVLGKNAYDREMALLGLKTFVISAGEATAVKFLFQRHRPNDDSPPNAYQYEGPFGDLGDDGSFVSRHATTSFAVAAVMAEGYKTKKRWVPWLAYSLASAVTLSRVYQREHWASDALAGACLGFVTGKFMYRINSKHYVRNRKR